MGPSLAVILLIGDSLAYGVRPYLKHNLEQNYTFCSEVVGGSTSKQWVGWIEKSVQKCDPDVIIVFLGKNDWNLNPEDPEKIINFAHFWGSSIVWVLPSNPKSKLVQAVQTADLIFDPSWMNLETEQDKIHLTYWSNEQLAEELTVFVSQNFSELIQESWIISSSSQFRPLLSMTEETCALVPSR